MQIGARMALWSSGAKMPTARDYVQDGLVAMWDGIENAGWGVHDAKARVWKDLSDNGRDAVLSGSINFEDSYINMNGGKARFTSISENECVTTEIIFKKTISNYVQIVQLANGKGADSRRHVGVRANNSVIFHNNSCGNFLIDVEVVNQVSYSHSTGICYVNGCDGSVIAVGGTFNASETGFGTYDTRYNRGIVYACRVYKRSLLAEEVLKNYAIDKARFGLT